MKNMSCIRCNAPTEKIYYKLCLDCWKDDQTDKSGYKNSAAEENLYLKRENLFLKQQLHKLYKQERQTIDGDFLKRIKHLCHPDKHGGSELATKVFQQLMKM
jgi:hypothetical protein